MGKRAGAAGRVAKRRGARIAGGARLTADPRAPAPAGQGLLHLLLDPLAPGRRVAAAAAAHQPQPGLGGQGQAGAVQVSQDLLAQHRPDVATLGQGARDRHRVGEVTGERLPGPAAARAPEAWGPAASPAPPRPGPGPAGDRGVAPAKQAHSARGEHVLLRGPTYSELGSRRIVGGAALRTGAAGNLASWRE